MKPLPIVAIVGRPNVGKSTLFNRYAGMRRAIVEDQPGVTRDRIVAEVEIAGRTVLIVDTAGLDPSPADGLPAAVQAQVQTALKEADAILFAVDGKSGLLPEDTEIARCLRRTLKPVLVVVNKIDVPQHAARLNEFFALPCGVPRAVSAEHGTGAWDALEELVAQLPPAAPETEVEEDANAAVRVALVGRPNVGKSSLLNRLLGEERVVVSEIPGTTRDAVDVRLEREGEGSFILIDTAGLRRPGRRREHAERGGALAALHSLERAEVALVVFDAFEGLCDQDIHVAGFARERGCAAALLANKWDLVGAGARENVPREVERRLRFMADTPLLRVSALRGTHVGKIFPLVRELSRAARLRVETSALNQWLRAVVAEREPPLAQQGARRRPVKFFYATQVDVRPPTFLIFCNHPEQVVPHYRRFLENRLRKAFGFYGTPVRLRFRARRERT